MIDHKEQERMVKDLEVAIERLQALYNQYFMGIEKLEPLIPKKAVERHFNELRKMKFYNTALRFRFQSQVQKYSTHLTHWRRICRQIEEGTYKRDIMRAKARTEMAERSEGQGENPLDGVQRDSDAASGLPVFDLEAMFNEVEDAFESGFDLDEQMNALTSIVPTPHRSVRDEVKPAAAPQTSTGFSAQSPRNSGIPIPISSLKASRKTDEAQGGNATAAAAMSTQAAPKPPPAPPLTGVRPPPPPPGAGPKPAAPQRVAPPPLPRQAAPMSSERTVASSSVVNDQKVQAVYRAYLAARKRTNEPTENINLQKISDILKKTEQAKGGVSDFKVVIRDGKAVIKAVK